MFSFHPCSLEFINLIFQVSWCPDMDVNVIKYYRDSEGVTPRCTSVLCRLFWGKGNKDPVDPRETSVSSPLPT